MDEINKKEEKMLEQVEVAQNDELEADKVEEKSAEDKPKRRKNLFSIYNHVNISRKVLTGVILISCSALLISLIVYVTLFM